VRIHREKYVKIVRCPDIAKLTEVIKATRAAWGERLAIEPSTPIDSNQRRPLWRTRKPMDSWPEFAKSAERNLHSKDSYYEGSEDSERRRRSYILLVLRWQDPSCQEGHGRCIDNSGVNQKVGHLDHIPGNGCRRDRQENIGGRFEQGDWPDGAANEQAKDLLQATAGHRSSFKICSTPASITVASMTRHHLI